jgi:hypothetical protein
MHVIGQLAILALVGKEGTMGVLRHFKRCRLALDRPHERSELRIGEAFMRTALHPCAAVDRSLIENRLIEMRHKFDVACQVSQRRVPGLCPGLVRFPRPSFRQYSSRTGSHCRSQERSPLHSHNLNLAIVFLLLEQLQIDALTHGIAFGIARVKMIAAVI